MAQPFWKLLSQTVREAITGAFADTRDELDAIAKDGGAAASGGFFSDVHDITGILSDIEGWVSKLAGDIPIIGGLLDDALGLVEDTAGPVTSLATGGGRFGRAYGYGYAFGYTLYQLASPLVLEIQHGINSAVQSAIPDPTTLADFVARGLYKYDDAVSDSQGNNLQSKYLDAMIAAAELRPGTDEMLQMFRREIIKNPDLIAALQKEGYDPFWQDALIQLTSVLISPADIALAVLRGEMTQDAGTAYVKMLGIGAEDFNTLVLNTGEPPGLEDMLFMFRRHIIDKQRLEHGIKQSRVRDEWIPFVEAMRYVPMSTADAARAVVENYMADDAGQMIAEQNGLEPAHWKYIRESWGRPLAHEQMADLVFRGQASRKQFDQAMRESDIKDKYIQQSFEIATRLLPVYQISAALKANTISLKDAASQLLMQGYDSVAVSTILKYELHQTTASGHALTKAEIVALYADGGFTREQALQQLEAIGETPQIAGYVLQLQDLKAHAAEVRAELKVIRDNYVSGAIDTVAADAEQKQLGLAATAIQTNMATWNREKRRASKGLSESQIVKAAKAGTYTPNAALKLLIGIGYAPADAAVLLNSNGVLLGPQPTGPVSGSDTGP